MPAVEIERARLDAMLRTGHADPSWFSASFLGQVPASKVDEIAATFVKLLGPYQRVEFTTEKFVAHFAKGTDDVLIHLDADDKIDGLFFRPPNLTTSSLDERLGSLAQGSASISYVVVVGGSERAALNASQALAVGSSFKLAVLNALEDEIARGSRRWTDVLPLQSDRRSLPSGVLQDWPNATPLTLATYAAQMISISDNTAADTLVRLVGQSALKRYADGNEPFLTTREAFILKSNPGAALRAAYLAASAPSARAAILVRVDAMSLPAVGELLESPIPAIEWHYSVRQLCGLMGRVASLPLMSINPGVADPSDFRHVAYKGGSDAGVINMTTTVTTKRGTSVCFSATVNNAQHDVDGDAFGTAYAAVLKRLASI